MQRIVIKNNGPIKELEMEINKFNLLIGEQATGKSTVAKSVYFSRYIKTHITNYLIQIIDSNTYNGKEVGSGPFYKDIQRSVKDIFIKLFGYSWDLNPDFCVRYEYSDKVWIEFKLADSETKGKRYITDNYSEDLKRIVRELKEEAIRFFEILHTGNMSLELQREERNRNIEYIVNRLNDLFQDDCNTYYIPAGRSLLTVMSESRATINSAQNLDFVTERFMELIDSIRPYYREGASHAYRYYPNGKRTFDVHKVADWVIKMMRGEYFSTISGEVLRIESEGDEHRQEIKTNFMSSGQQEVLWLVNFLHILLLRGENAFIIIEEPEAHIYPTLQAKIVEFISFVANACDCMVFITTHSPYVLTSFNNLYYAGVQLERYPEMKGRITEIVKEPHIIKNRALSALKLQSTNRPQMIRLLDGQNEEIESYLIDDVSDSINEDYTKLYNIGSLYDEE